jgi:hypothetical protein
MRCLLDVRFNMIATVLNDFRSANSGSVEDSVTGGHWETIQDPDTGALSQVWVEDVSTPPLPGTTSTVNISRFDIECYVRGFQPGFLSTPNTQSFEGNRYIPSEIVTLVFPAKYFLNRNQYITNIRGRDKRILWIEEETGMPTVFEVQGTTPNFDPFGRHIDNTSVLKRSVIQ